MSARRRTCRACGRVGTRQFLPRGGVPMRWECERVEACRARQKQQDDGVAGPTTAVGGYGSKAYEMVEDLAERVDWCARVDRDIAVADYVKALYALAAMRVANDGQQPVPVADIEPKRKMATANRAVDRRRSRRMRVA